ncbi:MAG TPA: phage tail protein [Enhygromyxa sp.]|nr:phage tail protein [Enhygromyxa sp.]
MFAQLFPPQLSLDQVLGPPLGHRFAVVFFLGGILPNPLDVRFHKVSGLSATIETTTVNEGGQNLYAHRLPVRVGYQNLVLERGFVIGSLLNLEFNAAMGLFKFAPSNVMVTLLTESGDPSAAWMFIKAYPVRWATADLDANQEQLVIDTLELAYTRMLTMRI